MTCDMDRLIRIAIAVSSEKRTDVLLDTILTEAMNITGCDGGTVYIRTENHLEFRNVITRSKGVHLVGREGEECILPPVPLNLEHVCSCAAIEHRLFNIADAYEAEDFSFSGTRRYDAINHYRTKSMLVVPMEDEQDRNIGVLQLINAMDGEGNIIPFDASMESIIRALSSLAAVVLNNRRLQQSVTDILHSFVAVMVDAIDARSPYNANHTRSMVSYAERFLSFLDGESCGWRFPEEEKEPFIMSVWLHDLGKLVIPLEIMDKSTRLGSLKTELMARIDVGILMDRIRSLEDREQAEEAMVHRRELEKARDIILKVNSLAYLTDEMYEAVLPLKELRVMTSEGREIPLLSETMWEALTVKKGTLTGEERLEMERHVVYTRQFLSRMQFTGAYAQVPVWAAQHHELLDGSGYPDHMNGKELSRETRLLTILDVYDALTAEDRPYKPPKTPEEAFAILHSMADAGRIDPEILNLFEKSGAWNRQN